MKPVTYRGAYRGGFDRMRPSERVSLTLDDEMVSLRRHRTLVGHKRIWARWSAVVQFDLEADPEHDGTIVLTLKTKSRGPGVVDLSGASADDVWATLAEVPAAVRLIPGPVREQLGVEVPEEPADEGGEEPAEEAGGEAAEGQDVGAADPSEEAPSDEEPSDEAPGDGGRDERDADEEHGG